MAHLIDFDWTDAEDPCRSCGRHQGECEHDGLCCRHCTHHDIEAVA